MSERSSISLSEVLGDNYYIDKLTSSDYSPSVGDTVSITLLVKDVFGDPEAGQTRTVTCTDGQFVSVNGSSITSTSSVSVTTGSGGTVTLGLSVNVADNIIVSDGRAECVVSSLSTSITNNVNTIYTSTITCNNNLKFQSTTVIKYRRVGKIVTLRLYGTQASPTSTGWINIASIPTGYKPIEDVTIAMQIISNTHITQARTNNRDTVQCYVSSAGTEYVGLTATWFTNDDYPSQ